MSKYILLFSTIMLMGAGCKANPDHSIYVAHPFLTSETTIEISIPNESWVRPSRVFLVEQGRWKEKIECEEWYEGFGKKSNRTIIIMTGCQRDDGYAFYSTARVTFIHENDDIPLETPSNTTSTGEYLYIKVLCEGYHYDNETKKWELK